MKFLFRLAVLSFFSFLFNVVTANPQGAQVVSGNVSVAEQGNYTQVNQSSAKAIVNWQSFNIGAQEHTHFQQPSSSAIILNRIQGKNSSQIFGKLTANGRVMLINPSGIVFGPNSRVDVAGLIASTADIKDSDFLAGNYYFQQAPGSSGKIVNQGLIKVGDLGVVALLGQGVENSGVIQARLGQVALGSGRSFTLDFYGDQLIQFKVPDSVLAEDKALAGITQSGSIQAAAGRVWLKAKAANDVVDQVINMSGVIEAQAIAEKNGEIILLAEQGKATVAGKLDVSGKKTGESGGVIKVLGEQVGLLADADIDASGNVAGGSVFIGGNYQGLGPELNANTTYVNAQAKISVDALGQGDGGRAIVWADDLTAFYGNITARGGSLGGNGGFVEVSGAHLDFKGVVDLLAPLGDVGELLLDPVNVRIVSNTPDDFASLACSGGSGGFVCQPIDEQKETLMISVSSLAGQLENGNLIISTAAVGGGSASGGDIVVDARISHTDWVKNNLTLQADRDIIINQVTLGVGGNLTLTAGRRISILNHVVLYGTGSTITINAPSGGLDLGAYIITAGGAVNFVNTPISLVARSVVDTTNKYSPLGPTPVGADITFGSTVDTQGNYFILNCGTGGNTVINGVVSGNGTLDFRVGRNLNFNSAVNLMSLFIRSLQENLTFAGNAAINLIGINSPGPSAITFSGDVNTFIEPVTFISRGGVTLGNSNSAVNTFVGGLTSTASTVTAQGALHTTNNDLTLGAVLIPDGAQLTLDTNIGGGNITVDSIRGNNTTSNGEDITLISGSGTTTITGAIDTDIGQLQLQENAATSTGAVSLHGAVTLMDLITFAQPYTLALHSGVSVTNATTLNNTGAVILGNSNSALNTFAGGLTSTASITTAQGVLRTTNNDLTLGIVLIPDGGQLTLGTNTGAGNITAASIRGNNTTSNGEDITLISGSGTTTITGAIDTDIGQLQLQENAATSTGAVSLHGAVTLMDLITFAQPYTLALHSGVSVTNATTLNNTGGVILGNSNIALNTFVSGLTSAASTTTAQGFLRTTNNDLTLGIVLIPDGGHLTLDTDTGVGNIEVSSITGSNATSNAENITLISGSGSTAITGAILSGNGRLQLQENAVTSTGSVDIHGPAIVNELITFAQPYALALYGGGRVTSATTLNNTGGVILGKKSDPTSTNFDLSNFVGGLTSTASTTKGEGVISTTNSDLTLGDVSIYDGGWLKLTTDTGAGNITVASIRGNNTTSNGEDITLISGSGTTTITGAIDTDIGQLQLQENAATSTGAVSLQGRLDIERLITFGQPYDISLTGGGSIAQQVVFLNTGQRVIIGFNAISPLRARLLNRFNYRLLKGWFYKPLVRYRDRKILKKYRIKKKLLVERKPIPLTRDLQFKKFSCAFDKSSNNYSCN